MDKTELVKGVIMIGSLMVIGVVGLVLFKWKKWQSWEDDRWYDVVLNAFSVSDDGGKLMMRVSRHWENGVISEYYPEAENGGLFFDFNTVGAPEKIPKDIEVQLPVDCHSVYFCRSGGKYLLVLRKNEEGIWQDVSKSYIYTEREELSIDEIENTDNE